MARRLRDFFPAVLSVSLLLAAPACNKGAENTGRKPSGDPEKYTAKGVPIGEGRPKKIMKDAKIFDLQSPTIMHHGAVDPKHTCDGAGVSPALTWGSASEDAKSFVVLVDDGDGKNFVHWLLFNVPSSVNSIPEGLASDPALGGIAGIKQGTNGSGKVGWTPLCPPETQTHRFVFRVYPLDITLDLPTGATRRDVEEAMKGHQVGQAGLVASYLRGGQR